MSSIKISELNPSSNINQNPSHSLFVTVDTDTTHTTKLDGKSLGDSLYANNILIVGSGGTSLPNLVAQFTGISGGYTQVNEQNLNANGTADYIVTADVGDDTNYFIDLGFTNSTYNVASPYNSLGTSIEPLSGYIYVQGNSTNANGNLIIGTVGSNTETRFISGGSNSSNIIVKITTGGIKLSNSKTITFGDGTILNSSSNIANLQIITSNNTSNIANLQIITSNNTSNIANLQIITSNNTSNIVNLTVYANSGYAVANAALANTNTITIANNLIIPGNLTNYGITYNNGVQYQNATIFVTGTANITGNLITSGVANIGGAVTIGGNTSINGTLTMNAVNFSENTAAIQITAAAGNAYQPPANTNYMMQITGRDNYPTRIVGDSYGTGTYVLYTGRSGRGTAASPTASQSGDVLVRFAGNAYGSNNTSGYAGAGVGRLDLVAIDNMTSANNGTQWNLYSIPSLSNTIINIASFNTSNSYFSNTIHAANGIVNTIRTNTANPATLTINMQTDVWVRANINSSMAVSLTNYQPGAEVYVLLTNTSSGGGSTHTITHGLSALNSSVGATTFTLGGTTTAILKYYSFDSDVANTYVSVIYS